MAMSSVPPAGTHIGDSIVLEEDLDPNYEPSEAEVLEYAAWLGINLPEETSLLSVAREGLKSPLPPGWRPCKTSSSSSSAAEGSSSTPTNPATSTGSIYYFNFFTGESSWEHPCDALFKKRVESARQEMEQGSKSNVDDDDIDDRFFQPQLTPAVSTPPPPSTAAHKGKGNTTNIAQEEKLDSFLTSSSKSFLSPSGVETIKITAYESSSSSSSNKNAIDGDKDKNTTRSASNTTSATTTSTTTTTTRSKSGSKFGSRLQTAVVEAEKIGAQSQETASSFARFTGSSQLASEKQHQTQSQTQSQSRKPASSSSSSAAPAVSSSSSSSSSTAALSNNRIIPSSSPGETRERLSRELSLLREKYAKDVMAVKEAAAGEIERVRIHSEKQMEDLKSKSVFDLRHAKERASRELATAESASATELRHAEEAHTAALAAMRRHHEETIAAMKKRLLAEERESEKNAKVDADRSKSLAVQDATSQVQRVQMEANELIRSNDAMLASARAAHAAEMAAVAAEHKDSLAAMVEEHRMNMATLLASHKEEMDRMHAQLENAADARAEALAEAKSLELQAESLRAETLLAKERAVIAYTQATEDIRQQGEAIRKEGERGVLREAKHEIEQKLHDLKSKGDIEYAQTKAECDARSTALRSQLHAELSTLLMEHTQQMSTARSELEKKKRKHEEEEEKQKEEERKAELARSGKRHVKDDNGDSASSRGIGMSHKNDASVQATAAATTTTTVSSTTTPPLVTASSATPAVMRGALASLCRALQQLSNRLTWAPDSTILSNSNSSSNSTGTSSSSSTFFLPATMSAATEAAKNTLMALQAFDSPTEYGATDAVLACLSHLTFSARALDTAMVSALQRVSDARGEDAASNAASLTHASIEIQSLRTEVTSIKSKLQDAENQMRRLAHTHNEELSVVVNAAAQARSENDKLREAAESVVPLHARIASLQARIAELETDKLRDFRNNYSTGAAISGTGNSALNKGVGSNTTGSSSAITTIRASSNTRNQFVGGKTNSGSSPSRVASFTSSSSSSSSSSAMTTSTSKVATEIGFYLSIVASEKQRLHEIRGIVEAARAEATAQRIALASDRELWKADAQILVDTANSNTPASSSSSSSSSSLLQDRRVLLKEVKKVLDTRASTSNEDMARISASAEWVASFASLVAELSALVTSGRAALESGEDTGFGGGSNVLKYQGDTQSKKDFLDGWRNRSSWNDPLPPLTAHASSSSSSSPMYAYEQDGRSDDKIIDHILRKCKTLMENLNQGIINYAERVALRQFLSVPTKLLQQQQPQTGRGGSGGSDGGGSSSTSSSNSAVVNRKPNVHPPTIPSLVANSVENGSKLSHDAWLTSFRERMSNVGCGADKLGIK